MRLGGRFSAALRPLLLFSKGHSFSLHKTPTDIVFTRGRDERTHPLNWQQPLEEAQYFVAHLAAPGSLIVDPFTGSGTNAVAVALGGQGRRFLGCDLDPACTKIARRRVAEALSTVHAKA
jgi:DNA modification methylase